MTAHNGLMQYFPEVCAGFIVRFCNALPTQLLPGVNRLDINEIVSGENLFKHRPSVHAIIILHTSILFFNKNWEACTRLVSRKMERYKVIKEVGDGTFGSVWRAINKQNSEVVAIKKMKKKYYSWEECMNLREVKSLRRMNHPNIVKLKEVIRENDMLYFVFEYMECNLYQLIKARNKLFSETEIRNWCFQIFEALAYMHRRGYFHRDLKPENLLVTKDTIKIADFGLAREVGSQPPYTEYVSTRWYRAPEVLLQSSVYDSAVDMWAMGAIMAEMFTFRPLFPGSSEADEIYKICSVIGSPSENTWAEGMQLADVMKYQFPQLTSAHISALIPTATKEAVDLISSLCAWNPSKRPKAAEVLHHSFFQPCYYIPPSLRPRMTGLPNTPPSVALKSSLEQKSARRYSTGALNNMKTANSTLPAKVNASFRPGVQKKLETGYREPEKNDPSVKNSLKQSRYRPPARNNPVDYVGRNSRKIPDETTKMANIRANSVKDSDVAEKLSKMTVSAGSQQPTRQPHTSMKAGGCHNQTDFLRRSYEIPPGRSYSRKVAG